MDRGSLSGRTITRFVGTSRRLTSLFRAVPIRLEITWRLAWLVECYSTRAVYPRKVFSFSCSCDVFTPQTQTNRSHDPSFSLKVFRAVPIGKHFVTTARCHFSTTATPCLSAFNLAVSDRFTVVRAPHAFSSMRVWPFGF